MAIRLKRSKALKIKKSIFAKLIGSFVIYAAAVFFTFILCLILEAVVIGEGNPENILPDSIVDESGNMVNLEIAEKIGGWVEELDESYNVTAVYGDKQTAATAYTAAELLELTSPYGKSDYMGFFIQRSKVDKTFLCLYRRGVMNVTTTLSVNNADINSPTGFIVLFFPLAIIEIVLISLYMKKKIKKPLDVIVEGMERLKSGDDSARISVRTEAEFEEIVDTFNVMAENLQREKSEKEQLTRKKNQMLLELSHDIKTPVATIKSYANALEAGLVPEEKIRDTYRIIDAKANRVSMLTDDMFMMLKMDNPEYKLNLETLNLSEFMRRICAEYYDEITGKGFRLDVNIPEKEIIAEIDADLFSRVVGNLLSNAEKYNKTGDAISVRLSENNETFTLSVSDNGCEIDKAFAEQMFNAFSRGDKARKTDGGTGLGLAISRIIAEKHGGNICYRRDEGWNVFEVEVRNAREQCLDNRAKA